MLHPHIEVRGSDIEGRGLFAKALIKKGEIIWQKEKDEVFYTSAQIEKFTPEQKKAFKNYSYQVGPDQFYGTPNGEAGDSGDYMNHSCNPNVWFESDDVMSAMRDIAVDEEICYDYSTSEIRSNFSLNCRCGSPQCRGHIKNDDYSRLSDLQNRYGKHVMRHVLAACEPS